MTEWMSYNNLNNIHRMSNTDRWIKKNDKMKVSSDCTVLYLSRMSSIWLFRKMFSESLKKIWYSSKKHAENTKTFHIEKKHSELPAWFSQSRL